MRERAFILIAVLVGGASLADSGPYEGALERRALLRLERVRDPAPEGKRIRHILIVPEDIISEEDPYPSLLNAIHVTTRPSVIGRELLFSEGEPWSPAVIEETERNLRGLFILAVALIAPLATDEPGTVDVLVVTKDLWSIRLNSSYNLVGSLLQYLRIRPTEQNLFGLEKQLSADFELRLDTFAFGQEYVDRRLFGTRLALQERANLIFNRATNALEGSEGAVRFGRPLYSLDTKWGFDAAIEWSVRRARLFRGEDIWEVPVPGGGTVPRVYDQRNVGAAAFYTRSFGTAFKLDVSGGVGAYRRNTEAPPGLDARQLAVLQEQVLPRSEDAVYLGARLRGYQPEYRVARDLETFALSEDYQVGPSFRVDLRLGRRLDRDSAFADVGAAARYRVLVADALFTASVAGRVRLCPETCEGTVLADRGVAAELLNVSPFVGPGRVALRAVFELRSFDLDNTQLLLGGGNGLRGAAPESLTGTRLFLMNLEYRTRPVELRTLHLGGVLFWDAGAAFDEQPTSLTHTVGIGLRALFPQFDVEPLRLDFGYVLNAPHPSPSQRFSSAFGQVTRYRPKMLDQPLD